MSVIKGLESKYDGMFLEGKFDSSSLFRGEMAVCIFAEDGATEEDAIRCIRHYNGLTGKPEVLDQIQSGLKKYFLYMCDEWEDFGDIYEDIAESLHPVMEGFRKGDDLITYLYNPTLYVYPQMENETGYGIECECPWEPEHQCCILIRNYKVVYVGPSEGLNPWGDESEYYCIWND